MIIWLPNIILTILNGIWRHDTEMLTCSSNSNLQASQILASKRQIFLKSSNRTFWDKQWRDKSLWFIAPPPPPPPPTQSIYHRFSGNVLQLQWCWLQWIKMSMLLSINYMFADALSIDTPSTHDTIQTKQMNLQKWSQLLTSFRKNTQM